MFDTIVIGNDLSSLIAALTTMHKGRKTLLLREGNIPDFYSDSGYTFNIDPFPWTGFGPGGRFRQLLSDMDIPFVDQSTIYPLDPAFQIIFPEHRIDLFSDVGLQLQEIKREFSIGVEGVKTFYESVFSNEKLIANLIDEKPCIRPETILEYFKSIFNIPALMWHKKDMSRRFQPIRQHPFLKNIFDAGTLLLSNLHKDDPPPLSFAYILALLVDKFYYHIGGKHHLIEAIERKFADMGGVVIKGCSIIRLNMEEQIKADVIINEEAFEINSNDVIISTKWEKFKRFVIDDERFLKFGKKYMSVEKSYFPFTIHVGLCDKGIPERMAEYVVIIADEKKPLTDGNLVFLEISAREDTGRAPSGKRAMSASVFLEDSPLRLGDDELKEISKNILRNIEDFLPFFEENLDFINIDKSIGTSRKYQEVLNQKYTAKKNSILGISTLSNITPVKNVFLTGGMIFAGLGFEGEIISGLNAANLTIGDG